MQLLVITPDKTVPGEIAIVNSLFTNGLQRLHVRKPGFTAEEYVVYIEQISSAFRSRVVLHSHYELYALLNAGGIHLNSVAKNDAGVMAKISHIPPSVVSASFHSWQEVVENDFNYNYLFISPIFDSISKSGYSAAIDLEGANAVKKQLEKDGRYCPGIIGLGGVSALNICRLKAHSFDGVALLGSVWLADSPLEAFLEVRSKIE